MLQIIVVQSGDSIYSLAKKYGTTSDSIVSLNQLNPENTLVIGEALVVNTTGNTYYVQPGDSLYKIGKTYNVSMDTIAQANGISLKSTLQIGQRLYIPRGKKRSVESIGYLQPTSNPIKPSLLESARQESKYLTYIAPFAFEARRNGTLKEPVGLQSILEIANQNRVIPMLVITNIENGNFNSGLVKPLLTDTTIQSKFITNILTVAQKYNMTDVHFDFEDVAPEDRTAYNEFLRNVKARLPRGYTLSTTLVPKTSADQKGRFYEAHDYKAHGQIVDFVVIMTYDWGWQGGPPMAVSPIASVKKVIQYAKTEMPASKIMMGQNLYGFDWTLPFKQGNPPAKAVSSVGAVNLARKYNVPIQFNYIAQASTFKYYDEQGKEHEVWFEDARSVQAKFNLIKDTGIRGISYWKLGLPFPQNWVLLNDNFQITKKREARPSSPSYGLDDIYTP
ncbi:LysM peptidoglycan-binding domain-containing protein [Bacillus sp. 165]|uniref:LysM peptidoglycan-binding domain-containing protein n=1 Tax=Bacillus sp. 165 TaxID=1529117 RepID=UPI001ADAF2E1|nr:LysM peptidoglycan-binding domain-containing protein [Bacillus sp. 165]MBO9129056.1 LysM peptidoglycan-binding domain-containing protein [Bacillus sp. 165]